MNIETMIDSVVSVENAAGQFYLVFPYTSSVGNKTDSLTVKVPIKHEHPSANDKKALLEAVTIQGGLGQWIQQADGSVCLAAVGKTSV